jgi:Cof subfamily protein (haloacid dehalogenase superfamily)
MLRQQPQRMEPMAEQRRISLVLADVDGTLVTEEKVLTQDAQAAVRALHERGIRFAITSGRPPRGMAMLIEPLALQGPIGGFNGGIYVGPDMAILKQNPLPADVARQAVDLLHQRGLDVWVYAGTEWFLTKPDAPHVAREAWTVKFEPTVVGDLGEHLAAPAKIVGVSDDHAKVRECSAAAQRAFGDRASAAPSQPYYLDITSRDANKGAVVEFLSRHFGVPTGEIATIGDQPNDVLMFAKSGLSIAMGNAPDDVKAQASCVTDSYNDEGFAKAMRRFVLAA